MWLTAAPIRLLTLPVRSSKKLKEKKMRSWGRGLWLSAILNPRTQGTKIALRFRPGLGTGGVGGWGGVGGEGGVGVTGFKDWRIDSGGWSPSMTGASLNPRFPPPAPAPASAQGVWAPIRANSSAAFVLP